MSTKETPIIYTHSGKFHADEVAAIVVLKGIERFKNASILRQTSREFKFENVQKNDVVVDTGLLYDKELLYFDHHQHGFNETFSNEHSTPLAASGLIWRDFGIEFMRNFTKNRNLEVEEKFYSLFHNLIYGDYFEHIDADDNGIDVSDHPLFRITTSTPYRVENLNFGSDRDGCFNKAYELVKSEIFERLEFYFVRWIEDYCGIRKNFEERKEKIDPSGSIMFISYDLGLGSVSEIVQILEKEEKEKEGDADSNDVLLYIYRRGSCYVAQSIRLDPYRKFSNRIKFPSSWCGLSFSELEEQTGIKGGIFCHKNGYFLKYKKFSKIKELCLRAISQRKEV